MAPIFKPESDKQFFAPFGPTMGYFRMPDELVEQLNAQMTDQLRDHSDNLVGKVRQELAFDEATIGIAGQALSQVVCEYHIWSKKRHLFGATTGERINVNLEIAAGWFVRQFENEYNPLHMHTGCTLSCVGYLALPDGIEAEWEEDYKDHHPSHGHIQFAHGTDTHYSFSNFMVKPQVGDFYIFPSHMFHCVYPFKTVGERRSFSMNMIVHEEKI
ncbi:MAG: hypothetical protein HKP25_02800 [Marinicaulis sp.]|nr:hypothetical protein [Marinicaulis sp.]